MLYSGLAGDDAPHEKGAALILSKEAGKSLKDWESISALLGLCLSARTPQSSRCTHQPMRLSRK